MPGKEIVATSAAPNAIGPYSQAVKANGFVFVSGCIPLNPATMKVEAETVEDQVTQVMKNMEAILKAAGSDFSKVVKTTILLDDIADFPKVNPIYGSFFSDGKFPARATYAVDKLPLGVKVEIEAVALYDE
eukprot:GGOE01049180.1.p1 GENE.GGOE01049180.1~~GGOE01049180.1.p1  ORF type:complete len:147 (-),score=54.03 GGOE01049180.1:146-538(-)